MHTPAIKQVYKILYESRNPVKYGQMFKNLPTREN